MLFWITATWEMWTWQLFSIYIYAYIYMYYNGYKRAQLHYLIEQILRYKRLFFNIVITISYAQYHASISHLDFWIVHCPVSSSHNTAACSEIALSWAHMHLWQTPTSALKSCGDVQEIPVTHGLGPAHTPSTSLVRVAGFWQLSLGFLHAGTPLHSIISHSVPEHAFTGADSFHCIYTV